MLQHNSITEIDVELDALRRERGDFNTRVMVVNGWGALGIAGFLGIGWVFFGVWIGYQFGSVFEGFMIPLGIMAGTTVAVYTGLQIARFTSRILDEWEVALRTVLDDAEADLLSRRAELTGHQSVVWA